MKDKDTPAPHKEKRNVRLGTLLRSGKVNPRRIQVLDCYNQCVCEEIHPTLTVRVVPSNNYFILIPQ